MEALGGPVEGTLLVDAGKRPELAEVQGINSLDSGWQNLLLGLKCHVNYIRPVPNAPKAPPMNATTSLPEQPVRRLRPCDPLSYRDVMGAFPTGVTVMTVGIEGGFRLGVTASSFNTVSLDPPLILWSLALKAPSLQAFRAHDYFGVNVLSASQHAVALQFARPSADKFAGVDTEAGPTTGVPLIRESLAQIECRVAARHPGGDHEIILGEVLALRRQDGDPLVFQAGAFHALQAL